jgi:hypothetical protein
MISAVWPSGATDCTDPPLPVRWVLQIAAAALLDMLACAAWSLETSHAPLLSGLGDLSFVILHLAATALFIPGSRSRSSRQWLSCAAVLTLPCAGVAIAAVVLGTTGRGSFKRKGHRVARRRRRAAADAVAHIGDQLSLCEALSRGGEERCAALAALARRRDRGSILLLRWAAAGSDPDLALAAALVLDQINERAERQLDGRSFGAELRHAAG